MKKFLMYVVVLVTMLFIGYTTYYFIRNNEVIELTLAEEEAIYVNAGESFDMPIVWTKPYKSTSVYANENVNISNSDILTYNSETKKFVATSGGLATVTITPSNEEYGPFIFDVHIGDGTMLNPYYVKSADELQKIGSGEGDRWTLTQSYMLISDIDLALYNNGVWTPLGSETAQFTGSFDGNGKVISNLKVSQDASVTNAGLFAFVGVGGKVENVTLHNATIDGAYNYAGAISAISYGKIGKCVVNNLTLNNTLQTSYNGGIVGFAKNSTDSEGDFVDFGSVDMCSATLKTSSAGTVGGIAGKIEATFLYNCKASLTEVSQADTTNVFGGLVGLSMPFIKGEEYHFSIVKNSYVIISKITTNTNTINGLVVGNNQDEGTSYNNIYKGLYYCSADSSIPAFGQTNIDQTGAISKTYEELQQQETYTDWDFENVWYIEEGKSVAEINQNGNYVAIAEYIPGSEIATASDLNAVLASIRNNPSVSQNYTITNDIEIDLGGEEWTTIAPDINNPLRASLVCEEGKTVTIKNFKLSGSNSSFFGYVDGVNTTISGLVFQDVTVNNNTEYSAVVATINTDATITNCKVINANITTGTANIGVGVVAGYNKGSISNCSVNENALTLNTITTASENIMMGAVSGLNDGKITNTSVEFISFVTTTTSTSATAMIGGIVGRNGNEIINCYNYSAMLKVSYNGTMYAGGVAGFSASSSLISKSFSKGHIELNINNDKVYVAGITGYADANSRIEKSFFSSESIVANKVAGITLINRGTIDQCYFAGELSGVRVAGLAIENYKDITNCSVLGSLNGYNGSSKVSGYVSDLKLGCWVTHCFSTASFGGLGSFYAESESEFRVVVEKVLQIFNAYPDTGNLRYCVTINYGNADVKSGIFGIENDNKFITCSTEEAKGLIGDYATFKNKAGFDQNVWTFDMGNDGAYPTLTNVVVDPRTIVDETPEVPVE